MFKKQPKNVPFWGLGMTAPLPLLPRASVPQHFLVVFRLSLVAAAFCVV